MVQNFWWNTYILYIFLIIFLAWGGVAFFAQLLCTGNKRLYSALCKKNCVVVTIWMLQSIIMFIVTGII